MNEKIVKQRGEVLREMARIERMEVGSLAEEYREVAGTGGKLERTGPYYKHQAWENGRNRSRRVPAAEAGALKEAVEGRQHFESLSAKFIELTVAATRDEESESKKNPAKPSIRRAAPKRKPS